MIKRPEAEKILQSPPNEDGAFLIRDSSKGLFALSMRDGDQIKHYRIRKSDEGGFFIARANVFNSLKELVEHYGELSDGLCGLLKKPCERVRLLWIPYTNMACTCIVTYISIAQNKGSKVIVVIVISIISFYSSNLLANFKLASHK